MAKRADLPIDEVVRRYHDGASLRYLAAAFGVSTGTIRNRLAAAGVQVRRPGAHRLDVAVTELVYETHLTGSVRAAARSLGVGRATASRRLAELHDRDRLAHTG